MVADCDSICLTVLHHCCADSIPQRVGLEQRRSVSDWRVVQDRRVACDSFLTSDVHIFGTRTQRSLGDRRTVVQRYTARATHQLLGLIAQRKMQYLGMTSYSLVSVKAVALAQIWN